MNRTHSLLLVLVGALLGGTIVWWIISTSHAETPHHELRVPTNGVAEESDEDSLVRELPQNSGARGSAVESAMPSRERLPVEKGPVFSDALMQLASEKIHEGWSHVRGDQPSEEELGEGLELFRERTPNLAIGIGSELGRRRNEFELALEDARTGGVFLTLGRLEDGAPGPLTDLVLDSNTFDRFFVNESPGIILDGAGILAAPKRNDPVPDGSVLTFPAGVFEVRDFGSYWREHFPRDLTLRGAGKNATLLVLQSDLSAEDLVRNMTFEDLSIFTNNNYLFDIRQPPMSLTMRRVRVMGWDMGAGGSCLFGTEGLALRAKDCDFLGGYGRSPSHANLFDIRHNGLLARFDNCVVSRTNIFRHLRPGATIVFSRCLLEELFDKEGSVPPNVTLDRTTLTHWDSKAGLPLARDLSDLFPEWRDRIQSR